MPSEIQHGNDTEFKSDAHRMLQTKSKPILLSIKPTTLEIAREWVGACNDLGVDRQIKMHFVSEAKIQKQRES